MWCGVAPKRHNAAPILRSAAGRPGGVMTVDGPPELPPQLPQSPQPPPQVPDGLFARCGTSRWQGGQAAEEDLPHSKPPQPPPQVPDGLLDCSRMTCSKEAGQGDSPNRKQ
ncbi:hypothetical protein NDU88_006982 [Pleurodeles waltl]|uniref:Uncharacterized protein n=1 Tax=Pleurodeles waltl TaxID=8319 RepID=A0AAV7PNH7_PLEWA|nr:hypothetical protein NDU88_006982 [Pleurodeles waltl]